MTPSQFVSEYLRKGIDDDGAYGIQCVDGWRVFLKWIGLTPYPTKNNWADGYWYYRDQDGAYKNFYYITDNFKDGDWVIWARGSSSHPSSHIAMYYRGQEFGQNQGGDGGFLLKNTVFSDALGALRWKGWTSVELNDGLNEIVYKDVNFKVLKGYGKFKQVHMLSAYGEKPAYAVKSIDKIDSDNLLVLGKINSNYFEMGQTNYGMHYGVEMSEGDGKHSLALELAPKQSGIQVFYQTVNGQYGYCTSDKFYYSKQEVVFACTPYSILVHNGQRINARSINFTNKDLMQTKQSGACLVGDAWHLIVSTDSTYPTVLGDLMMDLGATEGFICDGGGSAQMIHNGQKIVYTGRAIPNVLALASTNLETITTPKEDTSTTALQEALTKNKELLSENTDLKLKVAELETKIAKAMEALS